MKKTVVTVKKPETRNAVQAAFAVSGKRGGVIPPKKGKGAKYSRSAAKASLKKECH